MMSLPLSFEPNRGQSSDGSEYLAKGGAYEVHFSGNRAQFQVPVKGRVQSFSIGIDGSDPAAHIEATDPLPGKSSYFGNFPGTHWLSDIPNYGQLQYRQVYPGIDLVFYGNRGRLEYDFVVSPQASPDSIALRVPADATVNISATGDLRLKANGAEIDLLKPVIYQLAGASGREHTAINGSYRIVSDANGSVVKFDVDTYDRRKPLIIDPVLMFAESAPASQNVRGIKVDSAGNIYIAGSNTSNGALEVTKLAADATTVLYTANIITSFPQLDALAIDNNGGAFVVATGGAGLPTTASAYQQSVASGTHVYFAAINSSGTVTYATYLAGTASYDYAEGLSADAAGKAYIFGETCSSDFPSTMGSTPNGCYSPFVVKLDPTLSGNASLVYSNILATSNSYALEGAFDSSNNLYVALQMNGGSSLLTTPGAYAYQGYSAPYGVYVAKLDTTGTPVYVAYLGPGSPLAIAVEGGGSVFVGGRTSAYDFPATTGAFNTYYPGGFVSKLSPDGSTLSYSTFVSGVSGTTYNVTVTSLAVTPGCVSNCNVSFGGYTTTTDMPVVNSIQNANLTTSGNSTAFFGQMNAAGSQANFLSYFGGSSSYAAANCADDSSCSPFLAVDSSGNLYMAGIDYSSDFPLTTGTNSTYNYIAKISPANGTLALAVPNTVTFPYSQPVGVATAHLPSTNNYIYPNQVVELRNLGSTPINISGMSFGGSDFSETDNCNGIVAGGGTCQVQIQFQPLQSGARSDSLTVTSTASNSPLVVPISGTGVDTGVLQLSTAQLDFGSVNVATSSTSQSFTVSNIGNAPMNFYGFSLSGPYTETDNCPSLILIGANCTANVTFTPVTPGYSNGYIYSSTSGNYYIGSPTVALTGTGVAIGSPSLVVSPNAMSFGATTIGTTAPSNNDFNLTVQNTGTAPLTITSYTVTGDFTISSNGCGVPASLAPQQTCYLRIQFTPTQTGTRNGTLSVTSSLSTVPQTVSLTGLGITGSPTLLFNTTSIAFPDQPVGTVSSTFGQNQTIQLNNVGNASFTIYRVYADNGDFHLASDGCSSYSIVASSYCSVQVEFVPTQVGTRTGTVTFVTSAGTPQTVSLSGKGLAPTQVAVLNPTTLVFPDQVVGTPSSNQYVTIYNSGNVPITVSNVQSDNATEFSITYNECTSAVQPGSSCYEQIQFTPSQAGARSAHLIFTDTAPGSPHTALLTGLGLAPTGSLEINPTSIPFGSQAVGVSTGTVQVHVHNPGDSTVSLTAVTPSLADYVISSNGCSGNLTANADCYFNVAFDPTTNGARNGTITVTASNAPSQGLNVTGTGVTESKSLVVIAPATMNWGNVVVNSGHQRLIYLRNVGTDVVTFTGVTGVSAPFSISNQCGSTLPINTSCSIYLTFSPTATGTTTQTLSIASDASGSPHTVTLTGNAIASASGLTFDPNGIQFDQVPTGSSSPSNQLYAYLINNTGGTVNFGTPTVSSGFTLGSSNCPTGGSIGNGGSCYYYVQAAPTGTGVYSGNLSVNVQGLVASAPLTAYGAAPLSIVNLSQDGMLFPDEVLGNISGVQYVYVYNVGNSPVSFTASTLNSGADFVIQNDYCGGTFTSSNPLQPNSYCYVGLQFQPGSTGNRLNTLNINDSAGGHTVSLEGVGIGPASAVEIQPSGIAFTDTTVGQTANQQYTYLYNTGNVSVTFSASPQVCTATGDPCTASPDFVLGSSGGCVTTSTINPGGSCYQYVNFAPQSAGAKTAVLRFNDSASGAPHYMQLSGNGVTAINSVLPSRNNWNFPDTPIGASSNSDYIYINNTGNTPVTFGTLTTSSAEFPLSSNNCANFTSGPLQPGQQCYTYVTFTPSPTGAPGQRTATLSIPTSAGNLSVTLNGNATGGTTTLNLESTQVDFGLVPVGVQASQYLYLTNTGNLPITLGTPTISPSGEVTLGSSSCSTSLAVGNSCYIYVDMTPSASGPRSATITYSDNAQGNPHVITVNATGISNIISLSQTNLDYGSVAIGAQSPSVTVYYINQTSASVTVSGVTLAGTNSADYVLNNNNCSGTVRAVSYCSFSVYFKPAGANTRSATVTIADSTGNNQVVNLTGTGINPFPIFTVFPSQLVFNTQALNTTSPNQTLTVTNTGTANLAFTSFTLQQSASDFAIVSNGCQGTSLAPNQSCTMYYTFTPSASGTRSATMSFADNASNSPQQVSITGAGQPTADLAVTGSVSPQFGPPGDTVTYTIVVTDLGPLAASGVTLNFNAPGNATLQSVNSTAGSCTGTTNISCSIGGLAANGSATVTMVVTNSSAGSMSTTATATETGIDSNLANNTLTLTSSTLSSDIQMLAASSSTTLGGQPAFAMTVLNNGPAPATNVIATFDLDRFGYLNSQASQGSCAWNGVQLVCALGSLSSGVSATVTVAVQPPDSGWASVEGHASADQYDPNPSNNLAQMTPMPDGYNTKTGSNVSVSTLDAQTGATGNLLFASVTRPGTTAMAAVPTSAPPAGYRAPRVNETFNTTTSALFAGNVTFTLNFSPTAFWHPSEARLFHMENGAWVDRTASLNPAGSASAITSSLSQFAMFEPPNKPPVANAGGALIVAGTSATANQVQLNGSQSSDPENDALTYKWTGPFPEGNGAVVGLNPKVSLPPGVSQITLVVNDGEVDSPPVTQSVTVSDFAVSANVSALSVNRGQTAALTVALSPKFAAYTDPVTLSCANLPADLTCQFAQNSVTPGANGSTVTLTIAAAQSAALMAPRQSRGLGTWLLAMGLPFGLVIVTGDRKRRMAKLLLLAIVVLVLYMSGCGGGGGGSSFQQPPPPVSGATSTINVNAISGGITHSVAITVTRS